MREIKFRAWNKEKNIMVYDNEDGSAYYWDGMYASDVDGVNTILNSQTTLETYDLMQYTGLKDKNGSEIYEGDIIKTKDFYECGELVFKGKIEVVKSLDNYINRCSFIDTSGEVIGNVYENPELLEEI